MLAGWTNDLSRDPESTQSFGIGVCNEFLLRLKSIVTVFYTANIYLFQASYRNARKSFEICSKLTVKTPD